MRWLLRGYVPLATIVMVALAVRWLAVGQMVDTPLFHGLAMDVDGFDRFALQLLKGNLTAADAIYFNPLYPFFLALIYKIFGHEQVMVLAVQAVMDASSCLLLYAIGSSVFSRKVGLTAAFLYALYGIAIFYAGMLLGACLSIFLALSCVACLLRARKRQSTTLFVTAGILFGLLILARPNLLLFGLFVPLWLLIPGADDPPRRRTMAFVGACLAGFVLVAAPMSIRNMKIQKRVFPFSVQGGINFYIGNNPQATGRFMSPPGISSTPIDQVKASIRSAEKRLNTKLTPPEASRYWFSEGLLYLGTHPLEGFLLLLKKLALFWREEELPLNINYPLSRGLVPILEWPLVSFGLVSPFAMMGLWFSMKRLKAVLLSHLFVFSGMASVVVCFVSARYRLPMVPFLIIYAAYGFHRLLELFLAKAWKGVLLGLTLLGGLAVAVNWDLGWSVTDGQALASHLNNAGLAYIRRGNLERGLGELRKALDVEPGFASAHYNLAVALERQGRLEDAASHYAQALERDPNYAKAHYNLGLVRARQGRLKEAVSHFKEALKIDPDYAEAHSNLGAALWSQGQTQEAIRSLVRACALQPDLLDAHWNLCQIYWSLGEEEAALSAYEGVKRVNPKEAEALKTWMDRALGSGQRTQPPED